MPFISTTTLETDRPMDNTRRTGASKIFKQSIPNFILEEYPLFVEFLEAYYEWLDQHGNPVQFLQDGSKYFDIDTTTNEFLQHFKKTFLDGFPQRLASAEERELNERTLIKNIRELYKIKGSQKSIQLFFRLIAASDTVIEYPRDFMFTLSNGNYKNYHKIYVLKNQEAISSGFDLSSVEGLVANQYEGITELIASATVSSAYEIVSNGKEYFVFIVTNPVGEFIQYDFSPITINQNGKQYYFYPVTNVSGLEIINGGKDYSAGEFFVVGNTSENFIKGFISQTDYEGKITKVRLFDTAVNYNGSNSVFVSSPLGTGASFSVQTSVLSNPIEEYENNKNLLSRESKIQDSFEYQQYSYVVKSKRSLEEYIDAIKRVVHPSGFVIFNSLYNNIQSTRATEYSTRAKAYENTSIGSYAGYKLISSVGNGNVNGWNVYKDTNPEHTWGFVFSKWTDSIGQDIHPSEGADSIPDSNGKKLIGGTLAKNLQGNPNGLSILPNLGETQVAGITHFLAMPHPGRSGSEYIPPNTQFGSIKLIDVLRMPVPIIVGGI